MPNTNLLASGAGCYPHFELSHNSCQAVRRIPMVILCIKKADGQTLHRLIFNSLLEATNFWNNNRNSF